MVLGTRTDIGLYRNKNEDFVCVAKHPDDENIVLLALADGMGGKEHGEVASKTMVTSVYNFFRKSKVDSFNDLKNTYPNLNFISAQRFTGSEKEEDSVCRRRCRYGTGLPAG